MSEEKKQDTLDVALPKSPGLVVPVVCAVVAVALYGVYLLSPLHAMTWGQQVQGFMSVDEALQLMEAAGASGAVTSVGGAQTSDASGTDSAEPAASPYILPSDTVYLTRGDIEGMDEWTTALAINELYARHGYPFGNADIRAYFDAQSWYVPVEGATDPAFSDVESANLDLLVTYAEENGWR